MNTDYDENGVLKPGSVAKYRANSTVQDLNKFLVVDSPTGTVDGQSALSGWIQKLRQHYATCQQQLQEALEAR